MLNIWKRPPVLPLLLCFLLFGCEAAPIIPLDQGWRRFDYIGSLSDGGEWSFQNPDGSYFWRCTRVGDDLQVVFLNATAISLRGRGAWNWDMETDTMDGEPVVTMYFVEGRDAFRLRDGKAGFGEKLLVLPADAKSRIFDIAGRPLWETPSKERWPAAVGGARQNK